MDNKTCECTVGIWHNYEDSHLVTYSELKELSKGVKTYNMKDYKSKAGMPIPYRGGMKAFLLYLGHQIIW